MQHSESLIERVALLGPREWCVVAGVCALVGAVAWIGRNVGELIDAHIALRRRVSYLEGASDVAGDDLAKLEADLLLRIHKQSARQDRLQTLIEGKGKSWRDSRLETRDLSLTGPATVLDLRKRE